ncbi:hypothetical protein YB2330_002158 [Saitoella coloradoensis]
MTNTLDRFLISTKPHSAPPPKKSSSSSSSSSAIRTSSNPFTTTRPKPYDVFKSAGSGHEVSDGRARGAGYMAHRNAKLRRQFAVPMGSAHTTLQLQLQRNESTESAASSDNSQVSIATTTSTTPSSLSSFSTPATEREKVRGSKDEFPQIFKGCTLYFNGYVGPSYSDHRLKHLVALHGGKIASTYRIKSCTHVIVGQTGLAANKIQKELSRAGGGGVKFVGVEWVVESLEGGRRCRESGYRVGCLTGGVQRSVVDGFAGKENAAPV